MAQPEEIARVVAFIAGDGGSYMTSTTVFVDGGIMQTRFRVILTEEEKGWRMRGSERFLGVNGGHI